MRKQFFVFLLLILVSGCGGGGGSSRLNPAAGGLPGPTFTDAQIVPAANAIIDQSDSFYLSDIVGKLRGKLYPGTSFCGSGSGYGHPGVGCTTYFGGDSTHIDVQDIKNSGIDPNLRYSAVGEKSGVKIAQGRGRTSAYRLSVDAEIYGGWMDHSAFWLEVYTARSGSIEGVNFSGLQFGGGLSIGNSGSGPLERGATWSGIMWGATYANGSPEILRGNASVSYSGGYGGLEVSFTEIYNLNTNTKFQNLRWYDVVVHDGYFYQSVEFPGGRRYATQYKWEDIDDLDNSSKIEGRFYGPNNTEVGGVFRHNQTVGAFGAKRN